MKKALVLFILSCFFSIESFAQCPKGSIVISEVYFDSHYGEDISTEYHHFGEYIELFNSSDQAIDLNNWTIKDNHTEFKIVTNTANPNTVIQPGGFKVIIFGGFYAYGHIVDGGIIETGAGSGIGNREKFIELFPQAQGHGNDILVQKTMVLYNSSERISLYNPSGKIVHEISYKEGTGNMQSALNYLNLQEFTKILTPFSNRNGGAFNGAIGTIPILDENGDPVLDDNGNPTYSINNSYLKSIYLFDQENYYYNGGHNISIGLASPFTIPMIIPLEPVHFTLFDPPAPDIHWTHSTGYDILGNKISESRTYFNDLAKPTVSLSKDFRTDKTWGTETTYDTFGRIEKESFPALSCLNFEEVNFLTDPYFYQNILQWYYSDNNTEEPYQATATHPFTQFNYDKLNPDNLINAVGGNMINGEWKTGYSYTVPAAQEMYYLYGKDFYDGELEFMGERVVTKFFKTVSIDANGIENVIFTDGEGKTLASARSGGTASYPVVSLIGTQGYVDVHIPTGITSSQISLIGGASAYTIYNLKTGLIETSTLTGGNAYRIVANAQPTEDPTVYISTTGIIYTPGAKGIEYRVNYYDYSLNVYNVTGQLTKVIQPNGISSDTFSSVQAVPAHMTSTAFVSTYGYNSLGQLVTTTSPDEGTAKFLYRKDGQIRYSQSSLQASPNSSPYTPQISYTEYDRYGRPVESGVLTTTTPWSALDPDAPLASGTKTEQVFTIYDYADNLQPGQIAPPSLASVLSASGIISSNYVQKNLAASVAVTYSKPGATISAVTWYSYDIYGRAEWVVQYVEGIGAKTLHYVYDYNGQIIKVIYQKDKFSSNPALNELFAHKYTYDETGGLTSVATSTDNTQYTANVEYSYYLSGELKRKEYEGGIQGTDYVYTLGGQLKSINHPSLHQSNDPGNDSNDLFGLTLDYYSGDYLREGTNISSPTLSFTNSLLYPDQHNGNIKATRFANRSIDFAYGLIQQRAYLYRYNRNNWLANAAFSTVINNTITPTTRYREGNITYDSNGNILQLQRSDESEVMYDNLSYEYNEGKNQLNRVNDQTGATANIPYDVEPQPIDNYVYNSIGQLTQNVSENLSYFYNTAGLVTEVNRNGHPLVKFYYNDRGHRVKKESFMTATPYDLLSTDYYISDITGNVMAVYTQANGGNPVLKEHPVYGTERIGVFYRCHTQNCTGITNYELTDHLGNVRAVFKNSASLPNMVSWSDYYPFGEKLPGRNSFSNYRYAFQGQELDGETGMEAFQLRLWDGRIGRWLSPDPYSQYFSPYLGMGNNPISMMDPDGGFVDGDDPWWKRALNWVGRKVGIIEEEPIIDHGHLATLTITGTVSRTVAPAAARTIGATVGTGASAAAIAYTAPFLITGDESAPHVKEYIEKLRFTEFAAEGTYAQVWFWQTSSEEIVGDIKDRKNNSGYYIHYTTIESAYQISRSKVLLANKSNKVYVTNALFTPAEAFTVLFQSQPTHAGRGNAVVIMKLNQYQEASLMSGEGDIYEMYHSGTLRPEKIIYAGPNPFGN